MAGHSDENGIVATLAGRERSRSRSPTGLNLADRSSPPLEACVICLQNISDRAIALPCQHASFDFACLGTWLQRRQVCPLCKVGVTDVRFDLDDQTPARGKLFSLPEPEGRLPERDLPTEAARSRRRRPDRASSRPQRSIHGSVTEGSREDETDEALNRRRHIYRHQLYSLHVGTNRISRYRNLTPALFAKDDHLASRARMWIRRELQVFDFLNPSRLSAPLPGSADRRATNADFLLEYIVAILKSIDLKGSAGQAEELLKDFLGRPHAKLFLHELGAWLRSPYEHLRDWDRAVQYALPSGDVQQTPHHHESDDIQDQPSQRSIAPRWFSDQYVLRSDATNIT